MLEEKQSKQEFHNRRIETKFQNRKWNLKSSNVNRPSVDRFTEINFQVGIDIFSHKPIIISHFIN